MNALDVPGAAMILIFCRSEFHNADLVGFEPTVGACRAQFHEKRWQKAIGGPTIPLHFFLRVCRLWNTTLCCRIAESFHLKRRVSSYLPGHPLMSSSLDPRHPYEIQNSMRSPPQNYISLATSSEIDFPCALHVSTHMVKWDILVMAFWPPLICPLILRNTTMYRSARSEALLVGSTFGYSKNVNRLGRHRSSRARIFCRRLSCMYR